MKKDRFSALANSYAQDRPSYPLALAAWIYLENKQAQLVWDVGTGSGQLAVLLAEFFPKIIATDGSEEQIKKSQAHERVQYRVESAEHSTHPNESVDLITVAQAIHWFDFDQFYAEVNRVLKPNGSIVVLGYGLIEGDGGLNAWIKKVYTDELGIWWDSERRMVDDQYAFIPFPFTETPSEPFRIEVKWSKEQLLKYLRTWSAWKLCLEKTGVDILLNHEEELSLIWGESSSRVFSFPIFMRCGKKLSSD